MEYTQIFENNKKWVEGKIQSNQNYFKDLAEGQQPNFLFIGCSDSRVTAEDLMGAEPGDVFIHRNIANLVPNNDNSSSAVVEYAVKYLDVKHIIVCGHYNCGGIKAAMEPRDLGILNPWLRSIRDVYRLHKDELNAIADEGARYKRLVELNVREQCINVIKMAAWQKSYLSKGYPKVHALVFDIHNGNLIDLNINFDEALASIREIYDLGTGEPQG